MFRSSVPGQTNTARQAHPSKASRPRKHRRFGISRTCIRPAGNRKWRKLLLKKEKGRFPCPCCNAMVATAIPRKLLSSHGEERHSGLLFTPGHDPGLRKDSAYHCSKVHASIDAKKIVAIDFFSRCSNTSSRVATFPQKCRWTGHGYVSAGFA